MTEKLQFAARQALEALEVSTDWDIGAKGKQLESMRAITALREALAEQEKPLYRKVLREMLDAHEQAEQEPFDMDDHPPHRLCECRKCMEYFTPLPDCDAFAASGKPIAEQEPVAYLSDLSDPQPHAVTDLKYCSWAQHERGDHLKYVPVYAAPVQQVTRADLKAAFKEGFERAADLYAPNDGQEPYAYEVWDVQDQSFTMIYATQLKEFHWIEPENIARVLYAAPVRTKDLTDDEIHDVFKSLGFSLADPRTEDFSVARAVIAADREKNK